MPAVAVPDAVAAPEGHGVAVHGGANAADPAAVVLESHETDGAPAVIHPSPREGCIATKSRSALLSSVEGHPSVGIRFTFIYRLRRNRI